MRGLLFVLQLLALASRAYSASFLGCFGTDASWKPSTIAGQGKTVAECEAFCASKSLPLVMLVSCSSRCLLPWSIAICHPGTNLLPTRGASEHFDYSTCTMMGR